MDMTYEKGGTQPEGTPIVAGPNCTNGEARVPGLVSHLKIIKRMESIQYIISTPQVLAPAEEAGRLP